MSYVAALGGLRSSSILITTSIPLVGGLGSSNASSPPVSVGDTLLVQLNDKAFEERMVLCKQSFIARVVLSKSEKSWALNDLKSTLLGILGLQTWKLISLGKGFFHML